jgi:hexaprenyl-diphosphate synthase
LVDDCLDFTATSSEFGKPASGYDLELGLATAPVIFASQKYPELKTLIERRFSEEGDTRKAFDWVHQCDSLERTRKTSRWFADKALDALEIFPESEAKNALRKIAESVVNRKK